MSPEYSPIIDPPELQDKFRDTIANARIKIGRSVAAALLSISGGAVAAGTLEIVHPETAYGDTVDDALANYPNKDMPCEHAPYNVSGACANYDWGPKHTEAYNDPSELSSRGYAYRNCTDWVAYRVGQFGVSVPHNLQSGGQWYTNAPASERSSKPIPGEAAVVPSTNFAPAGHVAFVESVNPDGTITISEYNHDMQGHGDKRTGTPSSLGITEYVNFGVDPSKVAPSAPIDTDHDTIPDYKDDCPAKPGAAGYPSYGCPAYLPPKTNPALTPELPGDTAVSSWGNGRLDVYRRNPDGTVSHNWFDGGHWQPDWSDNLGGNIVGKPGAVSWGYGRIDLFGIGPDGKLKHKFLDPGAPWSGWESLDGYPGDPGCLKDAVSVASDAPQNLHIVTVDCTGTPQHFWLYQNHWQSWDNLQGCVHGAPTIASWGPGRLDVFGRACGNNHLVTKIVDQNGWSGWADMDGCLSTAPAVTSVGPQRLDVFARGCASNELLHKSFRVNDGTPVWLPWEEWGCNIAEAPSAVSMSPTRMDVISTDPNGTTTQFYFDRNWPAAVGGGL